jgi:hypothetical protein
MPQRSKPHRVRRLAGQRHPRTRYLSTPAAVVALLALSLLAVGCGPSATAVCSGRPGDFVLIPSTSQTDDKTSVAMAPEVSRQVVRRAAESCGRLTVGIQDDHPEADLVLHSIILTPPDATAFNTEKKVEKLAEKGDEFVEAKLLAPLDQTPATDGSPFLSTLAKVGAEMTAHGWAPGTIVLLGDGLVVERPPGGGEMVHFGLEPVPGGVVEAFVPELKSLHGSCVILVGAGAGSSMSDDRLRASQEEFAETLKAAGVEFVASRSPNLPDGC